MLIPDKSIVCVMIKRNSNTDDVYQVVTKKLGLSYKAREYFALFEIEEYNFGEFLFYRQHFDSR